MNGNSAAQIPPKTAGADNSARLSRVGISRTVVDIPLAMIDTGEFLHVRAVNIEHAQMLAQVDSGLPPILVHRGTMQVIDGLHRLHAARSKGARTITARFFEGSVEEAFVLAVESNSDHGLPLSLKDRKAAALRLVAMYPVWSDRRIATVTGLDHKTVGVIRRRTSGEIPQSTGRLGRDGRVRALPTAKPGPPVVVPEDEPVPDQSRRAPVKPTATPRSGPTVIDNLRRDPSLRLSESGRQLLRWLDAVPKSTAESTDLADQLPQHCLNLILEVAKHNADSWQRFADQVGGRLEDRTD
ncbi:ParB N-terminal domain-containing protein [Nocardia sp. NPDC058666]|uniref:ParB/RepB/Spo0J family partition protein n=1 Tax=Nocardia sp. NPDC058666 TaxID=3346587 RepID=UPI00365AAE93